MSSTSRSSKRFIPVLGLAMIASLAFLAIAGPASASQRFYSCKNVGSGNGAYEDSACSKEGGSKAYGWQLLSGPTSGTMKGTTDFKLRMPGFFKAYAEVVITCSSQSSEEATMDDSSGVGILTTWLNFEGASGAACKVGGMKSCSTAQVGPLAARGEATTFNGKAAVKFTPLAGETFGSFIFNGTCPLAGVSFSLQGSVTGYMNSPGSTLEFTAAGSSLVTAGGTSPVYLEGTSKVETAAGEAVKVAP